MTVFVTKEYLTKQRQQAAQLADELTAIRTVKSENLDKNEIYDRHVAYGSINSEEHLLENKLRKLHSELEEYRIFQKPQITDDSTLNRVCIYSWVTVLEENMVNMQQSEKTFGIAPVGGENYAQGIYTYTSPKVANLVGARVGDVRVVKIPMGTFKRTILSIQKMR